MALARALVIGAPDAGDESFWNALGIPKDMREGIVQSAGVAEIWPCNEKSFELFVAMQTQWRVGMGGPTGLDYSAIPVVSEATGIKVTKSRFDDLRIMESEALKSFAEQRKNK